MDFSFDISTFVTESQDTIGTWLVTPAIAIVGFLGRLVFVAYGASIMAFNPFRNFSGFGLIGVSAALFVGMIFISGNQNRVVHMVQRHLITPITAWGMKRDACDLSSGKYCVVIFEKRRDVSVNWFDKEAYMWKLLNPGYRGRVEYAAAQIPRRARPGYGWSS